MPNPIINRRVVLSGNSYSPEALAYFAALSVQPSTAQKIRLDNYLFKPLVAAGIFSKLDRLWIFASEIQANGLISLRNPTSTAAAEVNAPTWVQYQGYTGNGTTQYLNLNYIPSSAGVNFTRDDASISAYIRTDRAGGDLTTSVGGFDASRAVIARPRLVANTMQSDINAFSNVPSTVTVPATTGLFSWLRISSATVQFYRNGAKVGADVAHASIGRPTVTLYGMANNPNGGAALGFETAQYSMILIGSSTIDQAVLSSILNGYMTQLGTNVY